MPQLLAFIRPSSFQLYIQCILSKCSFLPKNVRESQPACLDCSLPSNEETKGIKVGVGEFSEQVQARGFKVVLGWVFRQVNFSDLTKVFV